jgi:hypothetical protein
MAKRKIEDARLLPCISFGHIWIFIADRKIQPLEQYVWTYLSLFEHDRISREKHGKE